ncbi:MAG TPA: S9 family peptidase, partial [Ferruginibacter sp.]|nr:S9 family peptidase [Ferruginibacter sp.]
MKKYIIALALLIIASISTYAQDKRVYTSADYDKATKALSFNTNKLVYRYNVNPNWLPDGKFWYSVTVPGGTEFVLINP